MQCLAIHYDHVHCNITTHVFSGVEKIHEAIGSNSAILIQYISTFLAAIVIGLVREYRLALLLLAVVPFMAIAGYIAGRVRQHLASFSI